VKAFDFARLSRLFASACAPFFLLLFATMVFGVAAPQRAEAAGTCTINWGTVAYRSTNNTYVMSQSVNAATLAACDPRYPAVDSGVAPPTSGASVGGGTWSGVTNAADNTLTYTPQAGRIGPDTFTMYFCNDAGCSGAGRLTATVNVTIAAPTLTLTSSLPGGTQSTAYSQTLTAGGGTAGYTFSVVAGSLPPGLSLGTPTTVNATTSNVVLSGTPTTGGTYNFTIRATDSSTGTGPATKDQAYSVTIISLTPTVTAVSPTSGPTSGGTSVAITGTNFTGVSAVTFGGTAASGFTYNSATSITATAPAGTAGTVDVRVTTGGGTSAITAADQFTYVATPTVTSVSPTAGPTGGGTTVIITGTGFSAASPTGAVKFGATNATYTINSNTQITATSPANSAGTYDVTVTTVGGTSATSAADQFTYVAAPIITSITPTSGPGGGGTTVTITGTNFSGATAVTFGATAATSMTVLSGTSITATAPAGTGTVDIRVTTVGGTSATSAADQYTYIPAPTVTSVSPTAGPTSGGTTVTINGTNFTGVSAVTFGATAASGFTYNSATSITATAPAGTGTIDIRITTPGGTSATSAADQYTYIAAPTVTSVSPTAGPTGGGTTVIITGTGFSAVNPTGAVKFGATNATYTINSNTQITATSPANSAGTYDVTVTNVGGTSATSAADQFTYVAAPTITSITPTAGATAGGTTVTITGTNLSGATAVTFGGTAAAGWTVLSGTSITATAPAGTGTVDIRVTTVGGTSATSAADQYTYIPAPTVTSISPTNGGTGGGTTVIITGTNFSGATAVTFGGTGAAGWVVDSGTQITATAPAGSAGIVDVRVTTSGGTSATSVADQFTYVNPPTGNSFTYGSIVGYNEGGNATTAIDVATGGNVQNSPTSYAVGSATTAQGGSVSIDSSGQATYTPPVGFRNANDSFTYTATNLAGTSAPATVTMTIGNPTFSVTLPSATATVERVYNAGAASVTASGGRASYTINSISGLPSGLTDVGGGVISGTPTADGVYSVVVSITDSSTGAGPYTANASATLTVGLPPPPVASSATAGAVAYNDGSASATSFSIAASATNDPSSYAVGSATTANGGSVSVDSAGLVSYTPPTGFRGNDSFTFTATNAGGTSSPATITVPVSNPVFAISLPSATGDVGVAYNGGGAPVTVTGGSGTYGSFSATGLPAGLSMSSSGVISGTPTTATNATVNVTVTDSSTGTGPYTSTVSAALSISAPTITLSPATGALPGAQAGVAYSQTVTATGGYAPIVYYTSAGSTPPGLVVAANGAIVGTPTETGTFNFTVTAQDSSGNAYTGSTAYSITVSAPAIVVDTAALPNGMVSTAYSQTLLASGGNVPYAFTYSGSLPPGLSLDGAGALTGTPTTAGSYNFTVTATDSTSGGTYSGSQNYTLVIDPGAQTISFGALSNASLSDSPLTLSATASSGLSVTFFSDTGATCSVSGSTLTLLQTGTCTIRAEQPGDGDWAAAPSVSQSFTITPAILAITADPATGLKVGASYSQANPATGGVAPYTYSLGAGAFLPGTTINPATGEVSGTPTVAGSFSYIVRATDSQPLFIDTPVTTVNIAKGDQTISFTSTPASTVVGNPDYTVTATSNSGLWVTFSLDGTSTGCTLSGATVTFTTPGTCVINANQAGDSNWNPATQVQQSLAVTAVPPTVTNVSGVTVGFNTPTPIDLSGSITGVHTSMAIASGPAHGSVSVSGYVVTYTPAANYAGADSFTFTATGVGGTSNVGTVSLTVSQGDQTISFGGLSNASLSASPLTLSATASSGLVVTFFSDTTAICTVSGTTLTLLQTGTCTIRAEQPGDSSWAAAPSVSQSFTVTPAILTISAAPATGLVVGGSYSQANPGAGGVTPYTYSLGAGAFVPGTTVDPSTGVVSGTPTVAGSFSYIVRVTDSQPLFADTGVTTVNIAMGNQTLAFTSTAPSAVVAGPAYNVTASATSGLGVTFTLDGTSTGCVLSGSSVTFTTPGTCVINANQPGDSNWNPAAQVQQSFAVIANPPIAADVPNVAVAYESTGTAIDLSGSLTGGAHTAITIATAPAHGTATVSGDVVTYTPAATYYGPDSFTYTATGPGGTSNVATVSLTVATPAAPVAADKPGVAVAWNSAGTAIDLSSSITGVRASIAIGTAPSHGTVTVAGEVVTYAPTAGYYGADSFTFTATGPGGTSNVATVSLTVANPPAPTVSGVSGVAVPYASAGLQIDLSGSVSGVRSSIAIATAPAHGTATVSGEVVTYTPSATYYGPDSFTFTATGPGGTSAPATVSLTVATPPPPVIDTPTDPVVVPPSPGGPSQPVVVNLGAVSDGVIDGFRVTITAQHGTAVISVQSAQAQSSGSGSLSAPGDYQLTYTPAANFMGTDTVTVVAYGPGGDSTPVTFTFQVAGKAPDLSGATPSNGSVTFSPTTTLVGGPFQALRITRAPAFGTATVNGLNIVFTPGAANGGSTSLDYVIDLPFGSSAAGRIDLVSNLVPGAQALTAETVQGHPVTVRISNTVGGPFTAAAVVSVSPTTAGTATIAGSGAAWDLTFTPTGTFSGAATVTFSLTNASGTTNGTLAVTVEARPDPGLDPEVRGVATSQVTTARRFADAQINNFQRRLQELHDGTNASSNGVSLNFGLSQDDDRDPRQALRRQLGQTGHRLDPGALGDDRDREMLGLDLWSGRASANGLGVGGDRLNMAAGQPSSVAGGGSVGFWTSGSVDWGRQDADGTRDSRFTTQGVTAGLDVRLSDQLIIGGGLGYGEDKTKIGDNGSVSNGQAFTGALYASWRPADAFYIDGVLGYADLDFDSRRWVTGLAGQPDGYADGSRTGDVRFASASFGRVTTGEGFTTDLYARLDARDITLDSFTETGGGLSSLIWSEVEQSSLSANLGASWRWVVDSRRYGTLVPSARIEWSHEFEDIGDQAVRYADWAASPNYLVPLTAWSRNSVNLDLDAEWSLSDRLVLGFGYRGALGDASTSHGAQIRVKYGW